MHSRHPYRAAQNSKTVLSTQIHSTQSVLYKLYTVHSPTWVSKKLTCSQAHKLFYLLLHGSASKKCFLQHMKILLYFNTIKTNKPKCSSKFLNYLFLTNSTKIIFSFQLPLQQFFPMSDFCISLTLSLTCRPFSAPLCWSQAQELPVPISNTQSIRLALGLSAYKDTVWVGKS